jgi:hypothetical protein
MNVELKKDEWWNLELESKPDFEDCMKRIYAWYQGEIIDRPPVRFSAHNSFVSEKNSNRKWKSIKEKWFDAEFQVESFIDSIKGKTFIGESFPVFWPNLGPNVFAAFYGSELFYDEVTSWAGHCVHDWEDLKKLKLDMENEYFKKIEELTQYALERCDKSFMVGYTDLHPGLDCVAAWRDTQNLLFDFYDNPENIKGAIEKAVADFQKVYDHFDTILKRKKQLSVTWMGIPSFGKMHIPSCDFSAMISNDVFNQYCLPVLQKEVKPMTHNIFHLDGKDVARHIDTILEVPEIQAVQWVQGVGEEKPIMRWIPLIKKIRAAGKSVVIDLDKSELEEFISALRPEGLLLCIDSGDMDEQKEIIKRIEKW